MRVLRYSGLDTSKVQQAYLRIVLSPNSLPKRGRWIADGGMAS